MANLETTRSRSSKHVPNRRGATPAPMQRFPCHGKSVVSYGAPRACTALEDCANLPGLGLQPGLHSRGGRGPKPCHAPLDCQTGGGLILCTTFRSRCNENGLRSSAQSSQAARLIYDAQRWRAQRPPGGSHAGFTNTPDGLCNHAHGGACLRRDVACPRDQLGLAELHVERSEEHGGVCPGEYGAGSPRR